MTKEQATREALQSPQDVSEDTRRAWVGLDEIDTYKLWKNTPLLIGVYTYADVAKEVEALLKEKNI